MLAWLTGDFASSGRKNFMYAAMTVLAVGAGCLPVLGCICVSTVRIGGLSVGMALNAVDLLRRSLMGQALYIFVAIHAAEHRAVD